MIAIVIPNWNGAEFLTDCLESLRSQIAHKLIVVDNGSVDDSVRVVERDFPEVDLIKLPKNRGFAGGVNAGIKLALEDSADYVALFNNDAIAQPDWLKNLYEAAKANPKIGIVTSKIVSIDGKNIDSAGDFYSTWGLPFPRGRGEADAGQYDQPEEVFGASGGASLYRVAMLNQIGLFDEDFFAYFEDTDISFRARLAGWGVYYQPTAVVRHHIGGTSSKVSGLARFHSVKNLYFVYTKNLPGWLYWKYLGRFWLAITLVGLNSLRTGQIKPQLKAWAVALIKFPQMLAKRWQIQRRRQISSAVIEGWLYHGLPSTQIKNIQGLAKNFGFKKAAATRDEATQHHKS